MCHHSFRRKTTAGIKKGPLPGSLAGHGLMRCCYSLVLQFFSGVAFFLLLLLLSARKLKGTVLFQNLILSVFPEKPDICRASLEILCQCLSNAHLIFLLCDAGLKKSCRNIFKPVYSYDQKLFQLSLSLTDVFFASVRTGDSARTCGLNMLPAAAGFASSKRGSRSNDVKNHAKSLIHCLY